MGTQMTQPVAVEHPDHPSEHPYSSLAARGPARSSVVRVAAATARNARARNEDAIGVGGWVLSGEPSHPLGFELRPMADGLPLLIAVTDGMGGAPDGDIAARIAAQLLTVPLAELTAPDSDAGPALAKRFRSVDDAIRAADSHSPPAMACTAALLMLHTDGTAVVAHVGDVRLYRIIDTYLGQLTEDHRSSLDDNAVTRCLGGRRHANSEPTVVRLQVRSGDRLILCSDGIHDALEPAVLAKIARIPEIRAAAAAFVTTAVESGHGDNPTAVVIDFYQTGGDTAPEPARQSSAADGHVGVSMDSEDGGEVLGEPPGKTERRLPGLLGRRSRKHH